MKLLLLIELSKLSGSQHDNDKHSSSMAWFTLWYAFFQSRIQNQCLSTALEQHDVMGQPNYRWHAHVGVWRRSGFSPSNHTGPMCLCFPLSSASPLVHSVEVTQFTAEVTCCKCNFLLCLFPNRRTSTLHYSKYLFLVFYSQLSSINFASRRASYVH